MSAVLKPSAAVPTVRGPSISFYCLPIAISEAARNGRLFFWKLAVCHCGRVTPSPAGNKSLIRDGTRNPACGGTFSCAIRAYPGREGIQ